MDCFKSLSWIYYSIISVLWFDFFGHEACGNLSSLTRDRTHIPCIGRWSLNLWTTREVPNLLLIHRLMQFRGCRETAAPRVDLGKIIQKWGLLWWLRWWRICLQCGGHGFYPLVKKFPWRRAWQPTPVFLPGESHGQRSLGLYSPEGRKESDMTEQWILSIFFFFFFFYFLLSLSRNQKVIKSHLKSTTAVWLKASFKWHLTKCPLYH